MATVEPQEDGHELAWDRRKKMCERNDEWCAQPTIADLWKDCFRSGSPLRTKHVRLTRRVLAEAGRSPDAVRGTPAEIPLGRPATERPSFRSFVNLPLRRWGFPRDGRGLRAGRFYRSGAQNCSAVSRATLAMNWPEWTKAERYGNCSRLPRPQSCRPCGWRTRQPTALPCLLRAVRTRRCTRLGPGSARSVVGESVQGYKVTDGTWWLD